jgi:hypothetical protein
MSDDRYVGRWVRALAPGYDNTGRIVKVLEYKDTRFGTSAIRVQVRWNGGEVQNLDWAKAQLIILD